MSEWLDIPEFIPPVDGTGQSPLLVFIVDGEERAGYFHVDGYFYAGGDVRTARAFAVNAPPYHSQPDYPPATAWRLA